MTFTWSLPLKSVGQLVRSHREHLQLHRKQNLLHPPTLPILMACAARDAFAAPADVYLPGLPGPSSSCRAVVVLGRRHATPDSSVQAVQLQQSRMIPAVLPHADRCMNAGSF